MACSLSCMAQIGIGTTTPDANAALELLSTTQGMLFPRMTNIQRDAIASPAKGLTIFNTTLNCIQTNIGNSSTVNWKCLGISPTSNGTAIVSAYNCSTAWSGILKVGTAISGVTQTITATVTTIGTYNILTTNSNGVIFAANGTFTGTGSQTILLTATGTPITKGTNTFTINTTPNCNFIRYTSLTGCFAKISATSFKDFLCHNLGADTTLDPHVPALGLQGGYIQWGRRGPNTSGNSLVDWQTAANTANFAAAPTSGNANDAVISGWNTTAAADNSWRSTGGAKTANDPCPSGYRVPTSTEWAGVNSNNTASRTGTFSGGATNYGAALHYGPNTSTKILTLPAAGFRSNANGTLYSRGLIGYYWSNTENVTNALRLGFDSSNIISTGISTRTYGYSLRCIEE